MFIEQFLDRISGAKMKALLEPSNVEKALQFATQLDDASITGVSLKVIVTLLLALPIEYSGSYTFYKRHFSCYSI